MSIEHLSFNSSNNNSNTLSKDNDKKEKKKNKHRQVFFSVENPDQIRSKNGRAFYPSQNVAR